MSATRLLLSSWRPSTDRNYDLAWNLWERWCSEHHRVLIAPSIGAVVDILAAMFEKGRQYCSLNCYRSVLSTVLEPIEGSLLGNILQSAGSSKEPFSSAHHFQSPQFWSVDQVLCHICSWESNECLTLKRLKWKMAMLLALCSAGQISVIFQ